MKVRLIKSVCTYIVFLLAFPIVVMAQVEVEEDVNLDKIPPRIIRPCCAFGYDFKLWGIPFVTIDQVISIDDLNDHHYMGNKEEGLGTVYTHKGGFIDLGHLRDQLDWTRYLYLTILNSKGKGEVVLPLRNEAGRKTLYLNIPADIDDADCILLAGKITYDLSLWHEISTWFGAVTIPIMPETFSSFSVEDMYSNLLGIHVGMKALHSDLLFDIAATQFISSTLDSLAVVQTVQETYDAYDSVNHKWYTNKKRIPNIDVTLVRDTDVLTYSRPWIVPQSIQNNCEPVVLDVPQMDTKDVLLTSYYQFTIDLNYRIPVKELFPDRETRVITQDDYGVLLDRINEEVRVLEGEE